MKNLSIITVEKTISYDATGVSDPLALEKITTIRFLGIPVFRSSLKVI